MQEKAANVGFDWDNKEDVWAKVHEEVDELQAEMRSGDKAKMEKEFGDLLFSLVNVARHYGINPDNALEMTNAKFRNRFGYVEEHSIKQGRNLKDMSLEEMDALWNDAKRDPVLLSIVGNRRNITLYANDRIVAADIDSSFLSSELAGGFVGCTYGPYAVTSDEIETTRIHFRDWNVKYD